MPSTPQRPNYPSISLGEAIEKVRGVYGEAHRRKMSRLEVARLLGYGSLNGAAISVVANLSRYGLLEGRGDQIRVSDDALAVLIEPEGSPERNAALRRLALRPELFAALVAENEGGVLPGETAVRVRMERMGLARRQAEVASRAFRETMQLVTETEGTYNPDQVAEIEEDRGGSMEPIAPSANAATQRAASPPPLTSRQGASPASEGSLFLNVPFGGASLIVRVEVKGQSLRKEHVERVLAYLRLAADDLEGAGAADMQVRTAG